MAYLIVALLTAAPLFVRGAETRVPYPPRPPVCVFNAAHHRRVGGVCPFFSAVRCAVCTDRTRGIYAEGRSLFSHCDRFVRGRYPPSKINLMVIDLSGRRRQ